MPVTPPEPRATRVTAPLLWALLALFCLRVAGQLLVAWLGVPFLPPMAHWYSGLVPYPLLLPAQLLIIGLMAAIARGVSRGSGVFALPRPRLGRPLAWLGWLYAAAMAVRYVVTMWLHPERRWLGPGTIPILFHWVLAAFLLVLARYHARAGR